MQLLRTAGIDATVYNVDPGRMLLTLQQGWRGYEVREFLHGHALVREVEWDGVRYPSRVVEEEREAAERAAAAKRRSKKARAKRPGAGKKGKARGDSAPESRTGAVVRGTLARTTVVAGPGRGADPRLQAAAAAAEAALAAGAREVPAVATPTTVPIRRPPSVPSHDNDAPALAAAVDAHGDVAPADAG